MILNIKNEYVKDFEKDTVNLATHMLQMKSTHLFIASGSWDIVYLELDDTIPESCLFGIHTTTDCIRVKLPDVITDITVNRLAELFPDKAGMLRRLYMQGKDIREVLNGCVVQ